MISIDRLGKTFFDPDRGNVAAVSNLSLQCAPGSIYGLIGPNGAGKTTTLRIVATLLKPSEGAVRVGGHDVVEEPEQARRQLGYLSTSTATYDRMTPVEMVCHFGRLHGMDGKALEERVDELFELLDMNRFRDQLIGQLSTGMKQKVSFARTIVHDPPVVVLDEPTSGLDIMVGRTVVDLVASLRDRQRTVLLSTHIMSEVRRLCDRVGIIHQGRLVAEGAPDDLAARFGHHDLDEIFFAAVRADEGASGDRDEPNEIEPTRTDNAPERNEQ